MKKAVLAVIVAAALSGCASTGVGSAPSSERGADSKTQGERFRTETLTPGVGSALFPDPGWR